MSPQKFKNLLFLSTGEAYKIDADKPQLDSYAHQEWVINETPLPPDRPMHTRCPCMRPAFCACALLAPAPSVYVPGLKNVPN